MKHYLQKSLRVLFLSLAVLLSLPMLAVEVEIDGINYDLVAKVKQATVKAKSSGEYSGEVVIPESVEHEGSAYSVTSIGAWAFSFCSGLTSVTIPNSVTSIGGYAFANCSGLTSVHISDIATWCNIDFDGSDSNPLHYAHHLYLNGEEVKDLVIPNTVTSIGDYAFSGCSGLTSVTIPNSVTSIGSSAFANCSGLTSVTIPNSVTSIGAGAFCGCSGLTSVIIGNGVESIGENAFSSCSGLTSVTIPNSVKSIGFSAFNSCSALTSVTIPNSVTSIGGYAFYKCSALTSVTIGNSVTSIGDFAFYDCSDLLDVYCYAENVPSTESNAFEGSYPEYATLHVPAASIDSYKAKTPWSSFGKIVAFSPFSGEVEIDGINYDLVAKVKQATVIAKSSGKYSGEVVIPESVEHEGTSYSVTSIGEKAFYQCYSLKSVAIPNSVTSIGNKAFFNCYLTSVTIPNSVESIGSSVFFSCALLTSVTIPNSVTSIGSSAFHDCSRLTSVHISDIAAWCNIEFASSDSNPLKYAHHLYLNGEEVKDLIIPNSVTSIGYSAFQGCSGLTSVTIPNSVTSIGNQAFHSCSGLTSVTIPNSVTSIGWYAFYGCSGLTSVTIPNSVTSIEERTFYECSGLTSVTIGNSVESIGNYAFSNCSELLDVYCYAEKVPSTKSNAFEGSYAEYVTLHVPDASISSYKTTEPWSGFGTIIGLSAGEPELPEEPEVEKCATPVVTYAEGKLSFSCETEGAEFVTDITSSDFKKHYDAEIELSATYNIEVYATKANYENSDTVSVALVWVENGEVNEETGIISVETAPVLIQGNGGILTVSGVAKGTDVVVYTISGTEVARATATEGTATISTGLQSGTIVVVKFGNKSVKVRI